jgi:hypothetical protein
MVGDGTSKLHNYVESIRGSHLTKDTYFRTKGDESSGKGSRKPSNDRTVRFQEDGKNGVKKVIYDRDPQSRAGPSFSPERESGSKAAFESSENSSRGQYPSGGYKYLKPKKNIPSQTYRDVTDQNFKTHIEHKYSGNTENSSNTPGRTPDIIGGRNQSITSLGTGGVSYSYRQNVTGNSGSNPGSREYSLQQNEIFKKRYETNSSGTELQYHPTYDNYPSYVTKGSASKKPMNKYELKKH